MASPLDSHVHLFKPGRSTDARTLLLLHGTGDDERSFARLGRLIAPEAAVLSVRGNVRENGMNRVLPAPRGGRLRHGGSRARTDELIAFLDAAAGHYGLDRTRVVGVGYSNGANILASTLFKDESVAPVAGASLWRAFHQAASAAGI